MELRMLGPLAVVDDGRAIDVAAPKQRALLICLALHPNDAVSTDVLIDALWDGQPPASASKLVQVYVSQLRKALGADALVTKAPGYALHVEPNRLDTIRFERLLAEGREALADGNPELAASLLRRGLSLWRGPALADVAYADFATDEAARLEELRLVCLEERIAADLGSARHDEVLAELSTLVAANPLRERLRAQLMLALYRSGRQADALNVYRETRRVLRDDLGLEPGQELRELERRILEQDRALMTTVDVERAGGATLPTPPNRLLGRERELEELGELLLRDDVRLLVLTGAGGSGKTRLAIEATRRSATAFANGVVYVELAPIRDAALLVPTIAEALGVKEQTSDASLGPLVAAVQTRELLLVLDNAEHLRAATPALAQLVTRAPRMTMLVTSRVVLHLSGEHVYPVAPLSTVAAMDLFVARAREADADFDTEDADAIRLICNRLDGLPLAIELAATRVRTLSPTDLLARLDARLPLLTGGPRDLPSRQRTLRATIEWSFDLLEHGRERRLLAALSVFAGGFTLDAVEAVCEADLDDLSALVDANLVQRGGNRYFMLETIREFAAEQLEASDHSAALSRRHAAHFAELASTFNLYPEAIEARLVEHYDLALAEEANVRAALEWALGHDAQLGLTIAMALEQHWVSHNPAEGKRHLAALIAAAGEISPRERARALRCLGGSNDILGDVDSAVPLYEQSLELYTELGDEWGIVHLRHRRGVCAMQLGEIGYARELFEGNLARSRAGGFRFLEAEALGGLGWVAGSEGALEEAVRLTEQHVEVVEEVGWTWGEAMGRIYLADLLLSLDRPDECETSARAGLVLARELGDRVNMVRALALLAARAGVAGEAERAGCLWGAIEAEETRGPIGRREQHRAHAGQALGYAGAELESGLAGGRRMTLVEAVGYALEVGAS